MAEWVFGFFLIAALATPPEQGADPGRSAAGLAYWVSGSGPTVVLLHGSNVDHRMWNRQVEVLERDFRVVRYDLRGHGKSDLPEQPFRADRDLLALLDELGEERVSLVGLSLGGQIAIDFALQNPERVQRMVLASPGVGGFRPAALPPYFKDLIAALQERDYDRANQALLATPLMEVPPEYRELVKSMVESNRRLWTVPPAFVQSVQPAAISRLGELKMPILVLVGDSDVDYIRELAQQVAEQAPNARLEAIPGGRHLLNLSSPAEFERRVTRFLLQP